MAIKAPGHRNKNGKALVKKRSAVAVLQLTAMVDMFTVLAVFLLQNYDTNVITIPDTVDLPKAAAVKELAPSNIVTVSETEISLNQEIIVDFKSVKDQQDLLIQKLLTRIQETIQIEKEKEANQKSVLKAAVNKANNFEETAKIASFKKLTIQADKKVDYKTIKKVMFTVTEAGIEEINFAVMENKNNETVPN